MRINIIVARAKNGAIGFQNKLIYHISNDLKRFKQLTTGHTIIMGRRTFLSLPGGALPRRRNIVLSRTVDRLPDCEIFPSLPQALESCKGEEDVFIIGGATLYAEALPQADRLYITEIDDTPPSADAFFPIISESEWEKVIEEHHAPSASTPGYSFVDYVKL